MFNETLYRSMNERIQPEAALVLRVQAAAQSRVRGAKPRMRTLRRAAIAAALALALLFAAPALAAGLPSIYNLMYAVSPTIAQFFVPVQEACEDNGVRMEVVAASVHGSTAEVYLTMRDLTGERIDETTDLYDSWEIRIPFDASGSCSRVAYDAETRTVTFLAQLTAWDGRKIPGDKMTFSVGCFISGKRESLAVPLALDWSNAQAEPRTQRVEFSGYSGLDNGEDIPDGGSVLLPGETLCTPCEGFSVSAMGYIDGKLHIQLYIPGRGELDDHAFLYTLTPDGARTNLDILYFGWYDRATGERADYVDYVLDVSPEALQGCALYGDFYAAASRTDGDWRVTFPLPSAN